MNSLSLFIVAPSVMSSAAEAASAFEALERTPMTSEEQHAAPRAEADTEVEVEAQGGDSPIEGGNREIALNQELRLAFILS